MLIDGNKNTTVSIYHKLTMNGDGFKREMSVFKLIFIELITICYSENLTESMVRILASIKGMS